MVASSGGHLREAMIALNAFDASDFAIATNILPHLKYGASMEYYSITDPHKSLFLYAKNFLEAIKCVLHFKPTWILSTGGGISIFPFLIAKLCGSKTLFIESGSRILYPSKTGKLLYRFSDFFIVQSSHLITFYPKALLREVL